LGAVAQEPGKVARIGMLAPSPSDPFVDAFKQGLRELGYIEGRNITVPALRALRSAASRRRATCS
jgi:putative ABC transport system substrate-binding protein